MPIKRFTIILFTFLCLSSAFAQPTTNNKVIDAKITFKDTLITTGNKFIIQMTDVLTLDDKLNLKPTEDYVFNYREGTISLNKNLFQKYNLDTFRVYDLKIEYDVFPYNFKDEYSNFEFSSIRDSLTGDTLQIATQKKDFVESLFEGTDLEKSGSLFRGFTVGSNRDLSLNSGFRLQLNGKLSNDIEIVAALTDENTPIQPEGNTQKLQELDKVFIELRSKNVVGTLGDINVDFTNTEFANFTRKIQGVKGYVDYGLGDAQLSGAISRGKFNTNKFNGVDGVQGPYRLTGKENEINILVLSGTERVYIDGIAMTRGDQADYTIDYGIGEITFTSRRIITNATRITVDFEYSDRKYSRSLISGRNQWNFLDDKIFLKASYVNENDNIDKTIDFDLTDEDRQILSQAGADRNKAVRSGISFAGVDSLGNSKGLYILVDTLIGTVRDTIYRYAPGNPDALYNVAFSLVGNGFGDYIKKTIYEYTFVGVNQGNYAPIVFIPIPTAYQMGDLNLTYFSSPKKEFYFNVESAYSLLNRNKFSQDPFIDTKGAAILGEIGFKREKVNLFGMNFHSLDFSLKERYVNESFTSLDRINTVEFIRTYDIQDSSNATEELREGNLIVRPTNNFEIRGLFGQLKRGDFFDALRTNAGISFRDDSLRLPELTYNIDIVNSDYYIDNSKSRWIKQNASLSFFRTANIQKDIPTSFEFKVTYQGENRNDNVQRVFGDSVRFGSFAFNEVKPRLSINNFYNLGLYAEFNFRNDDLTDLGVMQNESKTYTQVYGLKYNGLQWLNTSFDISIRDKKYSDAYIQKGFSDNQSILVNSLMRIDPFNSGIQTDLLYNISSERTAKIEKLFIKVPVGQGNYVYLGDLNSNGLQDENEFQLATNNDGDYVKINLPTDQLFPIVDVKTSARLLIRPSRFLSLNNNNFFNEVLNNLSLESYYRIDEKSKNPNTDDLYFLHTGTFLNDSNTLAGTQVFQQDVNFFEFNPEYSLRLRYIQQKGFTQYTSGNERLLSIQRSAKLKVGLTKDVTTNIEYLNKTDRNIAPVTSVRNRNIISDGINFDFSYRPIQVIESGFTLNFTRADDFYPTPSNSADINQQIFRVIYSFASLGRVRIELERDEIRLSNSQITIPFELTNGRVDGRSYFWRGIFDYSISKNIQASFNYDGRIEGDRRVVHTGRAEVRAFF